MDKKPKSALDSMKVGQRAVVADIDTCPPELLRKLVAMGLVQGSELTVTQRGFFGSPINIKLFGSVLSLRRSEAQHVRVQTL